MFQDLTLARERPTAREPLRGSTVLVVEDSRFASEAVRLLCVRSGARVRRADCLTSASRHLRVYRPSVVIVDMGLPDGSGRDLIAELAGATPRVPAILGFSGDPSAEPGAWAAGADGFLTKPIESLAVFQAIVLDALPPGDRPGGPHVAPLEEVQPDAARLTEDLLSAIDLLDGASSASDYDYLAHFLHGLALSAHDGELTAAVEAIREDRIDEVEALLKRRLGLPMS